MIRGKHIYQDEHVFIPGQNGSGKTILASYYLAGKNFRNVVVLDTKEDFNFPANTEHTKFSSLSSLMTLQEGRAIYTPNLNELKDYEYIEKFFEWIYYRKRNIKFR